MNWSRDLWGIEFTSRSGTPTLISTLWHHDSTAPRNYYDGEPTRALLFTTREKAREWCRLEHDKFTSRTDCCATWQFRPVRVRETVKKSPL
jgi:hypothetical protein